MRGHNELIKNSDLQSDCPLLCGVQSYNVGHKTMISKSLVIQGKRPPITSLLLPSKKRNLGVSPFWRHEAAWINAVLTRERNTWSKFNPCDGALWCAYNWIGSRQSYVNTYIHSQLLGMPLFLHPMPCPGRKWSITTWYGIKPIREEDLCIQQGPIPSSLL